MPLDADSVDLPVGVFLILRDIIRDRLGVSFEDDKRDLLASKVSDRLHSLGLKSFLEYYYLLKYGPGTEDEWPRLTDTLSVQETYFWREVDQIRGWWTSWSRARGGRSRATGCGRPPAHGEEPLSIAIALAEAGWFDRADAEVWQRRRPAPWARPGGACTASALPRSPPALRDKYFTPDGDGWKVAPIALASDTPRRTYWTRPRRLTSPPHSCSAATCSFTFRPRRWAGWCSSPSMPRPDTCSSGCPSRSCV